MGRDGKLYIRNIGQDIADVTIELFQDYAWGEQFKTSRVAYEDGIQDFKFGNETNNTIWINSDNMYIVDKEQVQNIYNQIKDLEAYSFEGKTIIDPSLDIGDIIVVDNKKIIYQGNMEYLGKFKVDIVSKLQTKAKEETTRTVISDKTKIRRVQSQINQVKGTITQLAQETGEHEEKITKVEQDVDTIKQRVENTVDFKRVAEGTNQIKLIECQATDLNKLKVDGIKEYNNCLYPSNNLYPSDNLYPNMEVI